MFRWTKGCLEENIIELVPENKLKDLIDDPAQEKTGPRRRTLAVRLGIEEKDFEVVKSAAGPGMKSLIIEACTGAVPPGKDSEKKIYQSHSQSWFKSVDGGHELAKKLVSLDVWPKLKPQLMPFINAIRTTVGLKEIQDLE